MFKPDRAVHFFVGNIAAHPKTFMLRGLFYPRTDSLTNRYRRACSPDPSPAASKGATRESNDRCPGTVSAVRYDSPAHDQLTRGSCETWALWTFHHSSVCATRHLRHVIRDTFTRSLVGSAALSSRDGTQHVETWDCAA